RFRSRNRENRDGSDCRRAWSARLFFRLDVARKYRLRRRQYRSALQSSGLAKMREIARFFRYGENVEKLGGALRHEGLRQDRDLPRHLGGGPQHGGEARKVSLAQIPRRFACEIAVGVRYHGPDGGECEMQLLRLHGFARFAKHSIGGRENRFI